ncbi:MAG: hypothetical protein Q7S33_05940 [Nanoarchaeota archaeon]|nr:hypothetical protein [Nanoarchaeota archaeon]
MNKKAQEGMGIGTIIIIIIGLVVLALIVFGFVMGWTNLFDKLSNLGGGASNVDTIVQSCNIACSTASVNDWCTLQRNVKFDKSPSETTTCVALSTNPKVKGLSCASIPAC